MENLNENKTNNQSSPNPSSVKINLNGDKNKIIIGESNQTDVKKEKKTNLFTIIIAATVVALTNTWINSNRKEPFKKIDLPDYQSFPKFDNNQYNNALLNYNTTQIDKTLKSIEEWERLQRYKASAIENLLLKIKSSPEFNEEYSNLMTTFFNSVKNNDYVLAHKIINDIHKFSEKAKILQNIENIPTFDEDKKNLINELINFEPNLP